jgi:hypothetical protein
MKPIFALLLVPLSLLVGCVKSEPQATIASAENFHTLFVDQLRRSVAVKEFGSGRSDTGNVHAREFGYLLPPDAFPPDKVYDAAASALEKWGQFDTFPARGKGGGLHLFSMSYGTGRSHAFVDIVAHRWVDWTRVAVYIRVFE